MSGAGCLLALSLVAAGPARAAPTDTSPAADPAEDRTPSPTLTGDWGGLRTKLSDAGINITSGYTNELSANVSGGTRHDVTAPGQFFIGTTLDTDKLFGLPGGTFQATISYRQGHNLATRAGLDTLLQPQEIYGRGQTWRLTEFWYRQKLGIVDLQLGRLTMGADFASQPCDFQSLSFCGDQQGNLIGSAYWFNYPISQWGARVKIQPSTSWYLMAGAYEYNPNNLKKGIALSHGGAQGATIPVEFGWRPHLGPHGLPGSVRVGAWYNTDHADDVLTGTDGRPFALTGLDPVRRTGRYGGYVLVQQQLTGQYVDDPDNGWKTTSGLNLYLNFTQTDRRTSTVDNQISMWLTWTAPFKGRPLDEAGFAIGRNSVNGRAAEAMLLATPGSEKPHSEYPMELFYRVQMTRWLTMSPNLQYFIDPGGYAHATNLLIPGLKTTMTF